MALIDDLGAESGEFTDLGKPLSPRVQIDLTLPNGVPLAELAELDPVTYSASTEFCDVRIGDNVFTGNLHDCKIRARSGDLAVDVRLTGQVPSWLPESGYWLYGEHDAHHFAWLPSVPQGKAEVTYRVGGKSTTTSGAGFHDHNWGNELMLKLMHHWYWARGAAGPYSVIASYITAEKKYGYTAVPVFLLSRDGS